jgi:UDP:flavonoid glycosyltransferase YjiC (YdhE family)
MAHIVFVTSGIASIYNAAFELARLLEQAGHQVTYASPGDIRQAVATQGIRYVQLNNSQENAKPIQQIDANGKVRGWLEKLRTRREQQAFALKSLRSHDFAPLIKLLNPDLLIIDIELHEFVIASPLLNVPVALLSTWVSLYKRPGVPPLHLYIIPGVGWRGSKAGIEWAWLKYRLWKWLQRHQQRVRAVGADPSSVLNRYADQTGFRFQQEVDRYQWLLPFSYRSLPVLCLNALEFDFPHQPHPSVRHLGAMIHLQRKDPVPMSDQAAIHQRLESLFSSHNVEKKPLVYCAFGAFFGGDDLPFFQRMVKAAEAEPGWEFVIGLGGRWETNKLGALPPNVHAFGWVPQLRVLQHADCAVIHGGISTINECIHFGVPMLVYPFKKTTDQMGNAARVVYHGLGIAADRDTDDPQAICDHIRQLLSAPTYKTRVRAMQRQFEEYRRENRAVQAIEALIAASDTDRNA